MFRGLSLMAIIISAIPCFAQKISLINSGEVINRGKELYDSGKYADAVKEFLKVPERDTNYKYMLTEVVLAYIGNKEYDKALKICEQGLEKPSIYKLNLLKSQAIATDKKGDYEKAVALFLKAIEQYPTDPSVLYNLGITYYNNKLYEKASDIFFKVLRLNPFHSGSHLNLGRLSIGQGKKTHAMLSMGMYLSINNSDNERLVLLNNLLDNQVTDESTYPMFGENAAEKLDQIIRARIAMDKKFDSKIPVEAAVVRQFEMFFQQIGTIDAASNDPWVKYYLPIYKSLKEQSLVEPFIYHILTSSSNAQVKKWLSKNEKQLTPFYQTVNTGLKKNNELVDVPAFGFTRPVHGWYDNTRLEALGEKLDDKIKVGRWVYMYNNHTKSAEGSYDDKGNKTGVWKYYYDDGALKNLEDYKTGETFVYYRDGKKREHFFLKNDEIDGEVELYYTCGALKEKLMYKDGKRHGPGQSFYATGTKDMTYQYDQDKATGEFVTYYENGKIFSKSNYKENKLQGNYISYHINGKVKTEGEYLDDALHGPWKYYYANGKLERTGNYTKGIGTGEWLFYDEHGTLTEKRNYDAENKLHGANTFYYNGKQHYIQTFKKDVLTKTVFYDSAGNVLGTFGNADGNFTMKSYFLSGHVQSEGAYKKGKADGKWKYYTRHGKLLSEYFYKDGLIQGKAREYHPSGKVKFIFEYKDNEYDGYFQEFYADGSIKQEGWHQQGTRQQQWLEYFPDGTVETDYYYLNGELFGKGLNYSSDAKIFSIIDYNATGLASIEHYNSKGVITTQRSEKNNMFVFETRYPNKKLQNKYDIVCGEYVNNITKWFPDGSVFYTYPLLSGKRHGLYQYNEINGQVLSSGQYVFDKKEGIWKTFYDNGQVSAEGKYLNNYQDSIWTYYHPNGKIHSTLPFYQDEKHGIARYFSIEGSPVLEKLYDSDDLLAYRVYANNAWGEWIKFNGSAQIVVNYSNGTKAFEEEYRDGLRQGYKRLYFSNGKIHEEYYYKDGDYDGPYSIYFANGKLREKGIYKNDLLEGKVEAFNEDGTLRKTEMYRMGRQTGKAILYNKGAVSKEFVFWDGMTE